MASKRDFFRGLLRSREGQAGVITPDSTQPWRAVSDWFDADADLREDGSRTGTKRQFLRAFLRNRGQVGAIVPSSPELAEMMVDWFDWQTIRSVLEYGPGTGVFTEQIEARRHPQSRFFAIEMDPELAEITRLRCPSVSVCRDSVTNVAGICADAGLSRVDAILSGLPWASFPESLQDECFDAMFEVLPPGGRFATFAYWQGLALPAGQRFRRKLRERFSEVHFSPTAWKNLPPAFVYRCVR